MPERTIRLALCLTVALSACGAARDRRPDADSVQAPAAVDVAGPMAGFARLVGGEWRVTFASGVSGYHAWRWGPGNFSMRRMTYASDAQANPWQGEVLYWHPGLGQVRVLSLHEDIPGVGRGVGEGTMRFEGETSEAELDLDQPRGRRRLGLRQVFDGPDAYHEDLLEDSGAGLQPLNALDFVRVAERFRPPSAGSEPTSPELPEPWKPFEALLGGTWVAEGDAFGASAARIETTFEWVRSLEVLLARVSASDGAGPTTPWLEAYVYRQVGDDGLRCLALSHLGGVYEGDVSVLDGGALQLDLLGHGRDGVAALVVRFDLEPDATLRQRVWSRADAQREPFLDARHGQLRSENG
jgi:hypothetical protein